MKLSRILVPLDFSGGGKEAVDFARTLQKKFDSILEFVHICEVPSTLGPELLVGVEGQPPMSAEEYIRGRAQAEMDAIVAHEKERGGAARGRVLTGDPADLIVETAEKDSIDLIVMGTHGRKGLGHLLLGSIADKVIRRASCPVLTVRSPLEEAT